MPNEPFGSLVPKLHPRAFVHTSAQLLGDVEVGEDASIWPTTVLRGDSGWVRIGARTSIQDGSVCHGTHGHSNTTVGQQCTVGHRAILHGCTVGDNCLIGMGSILLDLCEIGDESFVAAGSLVTPGKKFPPRSFIMGSPAKLVRECTAKDLEWIDGAWKSYVGLIRSYRGEG